jgi:2,3-bisphosphoglycerate-dependent phosphoglycerate mutase
MLTRVTLIRHGETAWNVNGRWQGQAAVPLNDEGRRQAMLLAEHLWPRAAEFAAIYSSDSIRAHETAELVASRLDKAVQLDARLREIDLGEWQGLTSEEVQAWDGERLQKVRADSWNNPRPGGESFAQVAERALSAIHEFVERHQGEHILAVSHGGTIRCVLQRLGIDVGGTFPVGNTSLTVLLHSHNGANETPWKLDVFNLTDHLGAVHVSGQDG